MEEGQDENSNTDARGDCNIARFRNFVKLDEISGIDVNSIRSTNVMYVNSNTEYTQYDVNLTLAMNLNVDIKITYPRIRLFSNEVQDVSKLRIVINNDDVKREIISCTNYLQRQRNANLALSILKKCAILIADRKLILDMLILHGVVCITSEVYEDGGIVITCEDKKSKFKFFESLWKIQFHCTNHHVTDFIDFSITVQDRMFYDAAKAAMNVLIKPSVPYNVKVELWWNIIQAANSSIQQEMPALRPWESRDYLRVRTMSELNTEAGEQYEILESDDEDCIVIEDD